MSSLPKKKAVWTPDLHKTFLELCLEEIKKGNKPTTHFTKLGWRNIVESFHKLTGVSYKWKQIRNHWDITKEQWRTWCKLIQDPNMKWDPDTNSFGASEEDWACYLEGNRDAAPFRFKEMDHTDLLSVIYDDAPIADGVEPPTSRKRQNESPVATVSPRKRLSRKELGNNGSSKRAANGKSPGTSSRRPDKAYWTPELHEIFVDLCLEQKLKGNKPRSHFTKDGWKNIMESFNEKAGVNYSRVQMKNHWDLIRERWRAWCKLIGTERMGWDPETGKFSASDQDWRNYLKENPEAANFRFKNIQQAEKLESIFDDGAVINVESLPDSPNIHERNNNDSPVSLWVADEQVTTHPPERMDRNYDTVTTPESRSGILVEKSRAERQPTNSKPTSYSIGECIQCLDRMTEVQEGSDLYLFALDMFLKKEYREIFLQLKNSNVRISWLQRLQSLAPPLHKDI